MTGRSITIVTLDAGYGVARVFAELEARRIEAIVPTRRESSPKKGVIPARRFKLDARHDPPDRIGFCNGPNRVYDQSLPSYPA